MEAVHFMVVTNHYLLVLLRQEKNASMLAIDLVAVDQLIIMKNFKSSYA